MLTKYSLQKQLVIIFSIIAIGVLAILLPIIDNNLTHVIDNEMYDVLTRSQNDFYSYDFSPDYAGSDKQIYHFTYNINEDTLTTAQNISAKKYQILDYVFQNDLYKMVKKNKKKLQEKVKMQDQTVYYQIVKADDSNYIISLVYSDYSKTLINNLKDQVIDIFYIAFLIIGLALFIWVSSLIKPLKLIKNYIDDIKNDKESELHIQREDEIGVLSSSLIENNKDTYSYLIDLLKDYKGYEVVVVGCTHFPLAKNAITKVLGNVTFVDGSRGIKNRVYDLIKDKLNKKGGKINIISTKDDVSKIILDIVKGNK